MTWDGPADERCDHCGRYVDDCNVDPCLPADLDDEDDPDAPHSYPDPECGGTGFRDDEQRWPCRACNGTGEREDR